MFREMRRNKQFLEESRTIQILEDGTSGVLALLGDEDYPYAVPLSYVYEDHKIYFHGAKCGHKIDALRQHDKASFCVIEQDDIVPEEYTTYFRSAIAFGKIRILEEESEARKAAELLARKYHPSDREDNRMSVIDNAWERLCMMELSIEHMTGKEAIELVRHKMNDKEAGK